MEEKMLLKLSEQLDAIMAMLEKEYPRSKKKTKGKMGRPTKGHIVLRFRKHSPEDSKLECVRQTGLSIKTVSKYWNQEIE